MIKTTLNSQFDLITMWIYIHVDQFDFSLNLYIWYSTGGWTLKEVSEIAFMIAFFYLHADSGWERLTYGNGKVIGRLCIT